jgi:hypothetical protein
MIHGSFSPGSLTGATVQEQSGNCIVTIREYVGRDFHLFVGYSFGGESSFLDFRPHVFNDNSGPVMFFHVYTFASTCRLDCRVRNKEAVH